MTTLHLLNFLSISIIIAICCWFTYFISGAKYRLYKAVFRAVFKLDFYYLLWYFKNSIYLWCMMARLFLICTNLTLITLFSENSIFQKPFFMFVVSPLLWMSLFGVLAISLIAYNKQKEA